MDNMAYLQQISASSKPGGGKGKFNFHINPKILIFAGIGIALIIFIIFIGSMLNRQDTKDQDLTIQAEVRITNLLQVIDDFTFKYVKSSSLRSMGSSLQAVLTETNRELTSIIVNDFGIKSNDIKKLPISTEEAPLYAELNNTLEEARISGLLDRVYAREFTLQIALLMSLQSEIIERTERQNLKEPLEKSNTDLQSLYIQFSEYSDYAN